MGNLVPGCMASGPPVRGGTKRDCPPAGRASMGYARGHASLRRRFANTLVSVVEFAPFRAAVCVTNEMTNGRGKGGRRFVSVRSGRSPRRGVRRELVDEGPVGISSRFDPLRSARRNCRGAGRPCARVAEITYARRQGACPPRADRAGVNDDERKAGGKLRRHQANARGPDYLRGDARARPTELTTRQARRAGTDHLRAGRRRRHFLLYGRRKRNRAAARTRSTSGRAARPWSAGKRRSSCPG